MEGKLHVPQQQLERGAVAALARTTQAACSIGVTGSCPLSEAKRALPPKEFDQGDNRPFMDLLPVNDWLRALWRRQLIIDTRKSTGCGR